MTRELQLFKYFREVRAEVTLEESALVEARAKAPPGVELADPVATAALVKLLVEDVRSGKKTSQARAILHILEHESGLKRTDIFAEVIQELSPAAA